MTAQGVNRQPYTILVGLDFGTAFTKCIVRNQTHDTVHVVDFGSRGAGRWFCPSLLVRRDGAFRHPLAVGDSDGTASIPYLKMALAEKAQGRGLWWSTMASSASGSPISAFVADHVEGLVAYFLVGVLAWVRRWCLSRWPDLGQHPEDVFFHHMSVPAGNAQDERTLIIFQRCLSWATRMSSRPAAMLPIHEIQRQVTEEPPDERCLMLAEVTANVLSYRNSDEGVPGLHLFVDVGAGTADLSVFWYPDPNYFGQRQDYPAARVEPSGSASIELLAWEAGEDRFRETLRRQVESNAWQMPAGIHADALLDAVRPRVIRSLRALKENGQPEMVLPQAHELLASARGAIAEQLEQAICETLDVARQRHSRDEFKNIRVLVGGGGWCRDPYEKAVHGALSRFGLRKEPRPLPLPERELDWPQGDPAQFGRFSVAYGLSFPSWDWPAERYPNGIENLPRHQQERAPIAPAGEDDG